MFTKLLENNEQSYNEQKIILREVLNKHIKTHPNEVKSQIEKNYEILKPILTKHWKKSLNIIFILLNRQIVVDYLEGKR